MTKCSAPALGLTINTLNRIADTGFSYDAAGNLIAEPGKTYQYDAENRMTLTAGVTYSYDGDGKRVKKSNGKLYWTGTGSDPLEETNLSGVASADFIFFGGKRTARLDLPGAVVHYYFANHLGSANVVTSSAGAIQDESDFYPFGGERVVTDTDPNQYKFTGKERDTESGLDFFIARYYSSQYGRFMIPDWVARPTAVPYAEFSDPQSLNLYGYVKNNPVARIDPDGHGCTVHGEKHGWLWCAAHKIGITKTQKELADQARRDLAGLKNMTINGQTPQAFANTATNQQLIAARRAVTEFFVGMALDRFLSPCAPGVTCGVIPIGRGSTGRVTPTNLNEQLAMEQAMADPAAGKQLTNVVMVDTRWPASAGWVKMEQNVNGVKIHYVMNAITGAVDDFKFVVP